jgi:hypothetical protein
MENPQVFLNTNDPNQPLLTLTIAASLHQDFIVAGLTKYDSINFADVKADEVKEWPFTVFSTSWNDFDLKAEMRTATGESDAYQVTTHKQPAGTKVDLEGKQVALKSGYIVVVATRKKMPKGLVQRDLVLTIRPEKESPREVIIPVFADTALNLFSITPSAKRFQIDKDKEIVDGAEVSFVLQFNTPQPEDAVKVLGTEPKFLQAEVEPVGDRTRWKLTIRIPKDNAEVRRYYAAKYLSGRVVLKVAGSDTEASVEIEWSRLEEK